MYLVQHTTFDKNTLQLSKQALINECIADNVDLHKLNYFFDYEIDKLFPNNSINETWDYWRHNKNKQNYRGNILYYDKAENLTDIENLPINLSVFLNQFMEILKNRGLNIELINDIEIPPIKVERKKSKTNTKFKFEENEAHLQNSKGIVFREEKDSIWNRIKKLFE